MWAFRKQPGFTIVELLIVIVVIAILAAITIIAYNGIQKRAQLSQYQSDAITIVKKAELFFADNAVYPTIANPFPTDASSVLALPSGLAVTFSSAGAGSIQNTVQRGTSDPALSSSNVRPLYINTSTGLRTYVVRPCGGTGFDVFYPDPTGSNAVRLTRGVGC
jgi:prepilin-type N-terminal cleavage/methylation domain-containing protein